MKNSSQNIYKLYSNKRTTYFTDCDICKIGCFLFVLPYNDMLRYDLFDDFLYRSE